MDRRGVFAIVFLFTLLSTGLVAGVSIWSGNPLLDTVILSIATMWITGIISQLLLQNLYQSIVKPLEEEAKEQQRQAARVEINLDEVEAIDEANQLLEATQVNEEAVSPPPIKHTETIG